MKTAIPQARMIVMLLAAVVAIESRSLSGSTPSATSQARSRQPAICGIGANPTARLATGTMSAVIDGVSWTATCLTVNVGAPGIIGFGGSDNLATPTIFGIGFGGSNTVGAYPVSNLALGVNAFLSVGTATWQSAGATGGTGRLTFTSSTPSRVVGTFSFTLNPTTIAPIPGNTATGKKVVTNGAFNITF